MIVLTPDRRRATMLAAFKSSDQERTVSTSDAGGARSNVLENGYFGLAHRDTYIGSQPRQLSAFIARFKHALLFTPKLILADHMVFAANFRQAFASDAGFRSMLREDLVDIAHFERFHNGRAFTLVELRKFYDYLRRGQDPRFDPRASECPSDPYDDALEAIQRGVGRRFPDSTKRDPYFAQFAEQVFLEETLKPEIGALYSIYSTAFLKLQQDCLANHVPLGMIHFDERNKVPNTENIFDYMARLSSMRAIPRRHLVDELGEVIAAAHRSLLMKSEMFLLAGAHAIVPAELLSFRTLMFANLQGGTIDEKEANVREAAIDLSAINPVTLAALSIADLLEIRKAALPFFELMATSSHDPSAFDEIWKCLVSYCSHVNLALGFRPVASTPASRVRSWIRMVQGAFARHRGLGETAIGMMFKVATAVVHTATAAQTGSHEVGAAVDAPMKAAEEATKRALSPKPLASVIDEVKASIAFRREGDEYLMNYE